MLPVSCFGEGAIGMAIKVSHKNFFYRIEVHDDEAAFFVCSSQLTTISFFIAKKEECENQGDP